MSGLLRAQLLTELKPASELGKAGLSRCCGWVIYCTLVEYQTPGRVWQLCSTGVLTGAIDGFNSSDSEAGTPVAARWPAPAITAAQTALYNDE
jgi:hypothetical protein